MLRKLEASGRGCWAGKEREEQWPWALTPCKTALLPLPFMRRPVPPPTPAGLSMRSAAQTLAWPCLSGGPPPCLWAEEGRDPRAVTSPKPNKARPWSLRAFQPHRPFSSLIIKRPISTEGPSRLPSGVGSCASVFPINPGTHILETPSSTCKASFLLLPFSPGSLSTSSSEFPFIEQVPCTGHGPLSS